MVVVFYNALSAQSAAWTEFFFFSSSISPQKSLRLAKQTAYLSIHSASLAYTKTDVFMSYLSAEPWGAFHLDIDSS